jgi:opacity protein-like surface antigen
MKPRLLPLVQTLGCGLLLSASVHRIHAQIPWATEPFSRQNKFEVYGVGQYLHQDNTTFSDPYYGTVTMKMDDTGLGGFGVAYHFNDFLSGHADFMFGAATIHTLAPDGTDVIPVESAFLQSGRFNLDYNMINRRLTPVLTAGIGYQYFEIDNGYTTAGPNGRYVAVDGYYYETDFTWNVGAGFRWNVTDNFFIKVMGGAQWLEYVGANKITTQIEGFFVLGWMF